MTAREVPQLCEAVDARRLSRRAEMDAALARLDDLERSLGEIVSFLSDGYYQAQLLPEAAP